MIYCIFLDFNKTRGGPQERWCDYQDGLCTLAAVSVATDTASDLLHRVKRAILREILAFTLENWRRSCSPRVH